MSEERKKFGEISPGTLFLRADSEEHRGLLLKIQPIGVSDGDPWHPGKGDRRYSAVRLSDGGLVEVSDEERGGRQFSLKRRGAPERVAPGPQAF